MMGFTDALKTCYEKSFIIEGRASRSEYWWFQSHIIAAFIFGMTVDPDGVFMFGLFILLVLVSLPANFCVTVRRWHDLELSGWHGLILVIPFIGLLVTWMFFCMPSKRVTTEPSLPIVQFPEGGAWLEELEEEDKEEEIPLAEKVPEVEESSMEKLERLIERRKDGEVPPEEFEEMKKEILERKPQVSKDPVEIAQEEVHDDYIDDHDTIVKDSVVSKSSIGAGGDDKFTKLDRLAEMKKDGLIDDNEFKQMKKEILGK